MRLASMVSLPFRVLDTVLNAAGVAIAEAPEDLSTHGNRLRADLRHELVSLGVSTAGFGVAVVGRVPGVRPLGSTAATVLSWVDATPRVRTAVAARIGGANTDRLMMVGGAVAQALAQRPVGLLTDICQHLGLLAEAHARWTGWQRWESRFAEAASDEVSPVERPAPLPDGPAESAANRIGEFAPYVYGGALLGTGSHGRALGLAASATAKPAMSAREMFAARLSGELASRGVLTFDPAALRRLDRVDRVVIDSRLLQTNARCVGDTFPLNGVSPDELSVRAQALLDRIKPESVTREADWEIAPLRSPVGHALSRAARTWTRDQTAVDARVMVLRQGAEPVGLVSALVELDPLAEAVVFAARRAGGVVLAGRANGLGRRLGLAEDETWQGDLSAAVRALQSDGHVVAVVSDQDRTALAAADVGIGIISQTPPWGAHVICGPGLAEACRLLASVESARDASSRGAHLAIVGSVAGALLSVLGTPSRASERAQLSVNVATVIAMGTGAWLGQNAARAQTPMPADRTPWHTMPTDTVLDRLGSSLDGIGNDEAASRADTAAPVSTSDTLLRACARELDNPLTPALATSAAVSASVGSIVDALLIATVLVGNAALGGAQRVRADRKLTELARVSSIRARVRRRGSPSAWIPADSLVRGDVITLEAGDAVPADCRLLRADGLEVDESSLTGESGLVGKAAQATAAHAVADRRSMAYEGTAIAAGRALAVVVSTGEQTELGRAAKLGLGADRTTGVARRLRSLTKITVPVSIGAGALLLGMDLLRGRPLGRALVRGIGLAVAAVPEGLPFVATVAELAAARRLSRRGALVRRSATIEALGRVNVLCFDKTGTLTEGSIALRRVSDGTTSSAAAELPASLREVLATALRATPIGKPGGRTLPHPTDRAVTDGAQVAGVGSGDGLAGWQPVTTLPFEPSRGYHAVLGQSPGGWTLSVKGAPEVLLARCTRWRRPDGDVAFGADARAEVEREIDRLARRGYRVLAVAQRDATSCRELHGSRVERLCLVGLLALADPIRPTARDSVDTLRAAGIEVVMVTGDHPSTAEAIASEANLLGQRGVLTGPELDALDDHQLDERLAGIAVYARVSPLQKVRIVAALQRAGLVVAVTGDGANDAPAIRLADVGMALGSRATAAARHAADVVITDDRIETIADAVVEGRSMWASVRNGLAILLGGNLGEIAFTVVAGALSAAETLNVRQLLLINLLTDVLPAMAVASRPPADRSVASLLAEGPEASLGTALNREITMRAITTAAAGLVTWALARMTLARRQAGTAALLALVGAQLGQTMAVRGRSPIVLASGAASLAVLALVVQVPGISHFFGCRPLWPHLWLLALGCSAAATVAAMLTQRG